MSDLRAMLTTSTAAESIIDATPAPDAAPAAPAKTAPAPEPDTHAGERDAAGQFVAKEPADTPGVARRIVLPIPWTDRFLRPFYEILRFGRASCGSRFLQRHSLGVLRETGVCSRDRSIPGSIDFRPWSDADKFVCETDRRQSRFQAWQRSPRLHEVCRSGGWNLAPEGG